MKVERTSRVGHSCNFCDKGKLDPNSHAALIYPYKHVTIFCSESGGGIKASICDDCLDELTAKSAMAAL